MGRDIRKVLLIGPMPPPPGGVSVHLSRLLQLSENAQGLRLSVLDLRKRRWFGKSKQSGNWFRLLYELFTADIIHIHISKPLKSWLGKISKVLGKKLVYTQHNLRDLENKATLQIMKDADRIIFVQEPSPFPGNFRDKISVIPAYLPSIENPPVPEWFKAELQAYPNIILSLSFHEPGRPTLHEGKDLYGFDQILEVLPRIHEKINLKGWMLLLIDPNGTMTSFYSPKMDRVQKQTGIRMIFINEPFDILPVLASCKMLLRTTWSDGDALSLREALAAGIPAIASDCVPRPQGTIVYKTGDLSELEEKITAVIQNPYRITFRQPDFSQSIFQLYSSL
ncbi:MAG TPA: hypothetical protein PLU53_11200 [Bacteroidia bacterium]|nr:hypothetical protein [Bacteroidia bacterium]